ncbi:hypothetical protein SFMTTN_2277 [Sulfuriferula multivorans]|uniref:Uncharacterized protein n=1 Tax=Sulfuriferula multivorans TaxID=1559896 RepID=A0A401JFU2_9PROT|nr:hypothetical protein [Sulfuriferula multivorans]GBL46463.1 hypothetical protein SFMTTN_2277 [Sulfuriferula multivorans]
MSEVKRNEVSINSELFYSMENATAGLAALGDLMRNVDKDHLDESTFDGIAQLLEILSKPFFDAVLDGHGLGADKEIARPRQEANKTPH